MTNALFGFMAFAHVDDVARAHLAAALMPSTFGQIYNIAGAETITINGYIDLIADIVGTRSRKIYLDWSAMKQARPCIFPFPWDKSAYYSIAKARQAFGWTPHFDIKSGLLQTYHWWCTALGVEKTQFVPGKLGNDVDLNYEAELIQAH